MEKAENFKLEAVLKQVEGSREGWDVVRWTGQEDNVDGCPLDGLGVSVTGDNGKRKQCWRYGPQKGCCIKRAMPLHKKANATLGCIMCKTSEGVIPL